MGILRSVKDFVFQKGYEDDEYLYEDEYDTGGDDGFTRMRDDDVAYIGSGRRAAPRESGVRSRNAGGVEPRRGDTTEITSRSTSAGLKYSEKDNVYTIPYAADIDIVVYEPGNFDDGLAICDFLKQRKPVIVNMGGVEFQEAQRIMDFLAGVVYCINGDIQEITSRIFVVAPENVNVSDHAKEHLKQQGIFSSFKTAFGR
ncbi:MAG: cell division protein SepF [Clostridiales bacterium]|jgi:cell division inhibitor SepF|nr:cell division protein SepF [Clostridiales bacterium]